MATVQRAPPSVDVATVAPPGLVPAATQSDGFAHDSVVASGSAAGSVERCCHDEPLSVVSKTAVSVVALTSARHLPGPVQASAAMPEPGGCVAVTEATFRAGFTSIRSEPPCAEPPRRHPDDQHAAVVRVAPVTGGVAAGAHTPRPPAETSMEAACVEVVGFVPAATHHASGSQARTDNVTLGTIAP